MLKTLCDVARRAIGTVTQVVGDLVERVRPAARCSLVFRPARWLNDQLWGSGRGYFLVPPTRGDLAEIDRDNYRAAWRTDAPVVIKFKRKLVHLIPGNMNGVTRSRFENGEALLRYNAQAGNGSLRLPSEVLDELENNGTVVIFPMEARLMLEELRRDVGDLGYVHWTKGIVNPFARHVIILGIYDSLVRICDTVGKSQRPHALLYIPIGPRCGRLWRFGLKRVQMQ